MNYQFDVVRITKNPEKYPECKEDSNKHSHLVKYVSDEMDVFIIRRDDPERFWWRANEFFYIEKIETFRAVVG